MELRGNCFFIMCIFLFEVSSVSFVPKKDGLVDIDEIYAIINEIWYLFWKVKSTGLMEQNSWCFFKDGYR